MNQDRPHRDRLDIFDEILLDQNKKLVRKGTAQVQVLEF